MLREGTSIDSDENDDKTLAEVAGSESAPTLQEGEPDSVSSYEPDAEEEREQLSKKEQARREWRARNDKVAQIEKTVEDMRAETRQELAKRDELINRLNAENARLQGRQEAAATPAAQEPEPDDLRRQAREALKAEKFDDYERLRDEAVRIETRRLVRGELDQVRQQIPRPNPQGDAIRREIDAQMMTHREVRKHPNGFQYVAAKVQALLALGEPDTPDTRERAWDEAEAELAAKNGKPRFDPNDGAALRGTRSGTESTTESAESSELTPLQKKMARLARMSDEEYKKYM